MDGQIAGQQIAQEVGSPAPRKFLADAKRCAAAAQYRCAKFEYEVAVLSCDHLVQWTLLAGDELAERDAE